jgi:hypothetical protein
MPRRPQSHGGPRRSQLNCRNTTRRGPAWPPGTRYLVVVTTSRDSRGNPSANQRQTY